jgi:type VI secretion system protein ImpG
VRIANITRPTLPSPPPSDSTFLWHFLAHLGSTYASLASAESLQALLRVYDRSGKVDRSRRIEAISGVRTEPVDTIFRNAVIRGMRLTVIMNENEAGDTGQLRLFGDVLASFFRQYASINSFVQLRIELSPSGKQLDWEPLDGSRTSI